MVAGTWKTVKGLHATFEILQGSVPVSNVANSMDALKLSIIG